VNEPLRAVRRIALLRCNALGDYLITTPALTPLQAENAAPLDATVPYRYYQGEVFRFFGVVALVGAEGPPEYPELAVSEQERAAAAELLPGNGPRVALHAGAGDPRRRWAPSGSPP
jgi:ADP-heptose:LPS heptosyltransferase